MENKKTVAILCAGGPAPGINERPGQYYSDRCGEQVACPQAVLLLCWIIGIIKVPATSRNRIKTPGLVTHSTP